MTDQRLRRLERDAAANPSPESEAALLRERLRAGTLSLERLELAAYCHPPGAYLGGFAPWIVLGWVNGRECVNEARVSGRAVPAGETHFEWCPGSRRYRHPDERARLAWWVAGLSRWGPEVQVRAAVAAARVALPFWDAGRSEVREAAEEGLRRVKDWLDGTDGTTHRVRAAHDGGGPFAGIPHGIRSVLSIAIRAEARDERGMGIDMPATIRWAVAQFNHHRFAPEHGEPRVRAAIQSALISWALGSKG